MGFQKVCREEDVALGGKKRFRMENRTILLFHLEEGFFATAAHCPHVMAPLQRGKMVEECVIQCPFHRAQFDVRTGEVRKWATFPPGIADFLNLFRKKKNLATYPVQVENGEVWVNPEP